MSFGSLCKMVTTLEVPIARFFIAQINYSFVKKSISKFSLITYAICSFLKNESIFLIMKFIVPEKVQ